MKNPARSKRDISRKSGTNRQTDRQTDTHTHTHTHRERERERERETHTDKVCRSL